MRFGEVSAAVCVGVLTVIRPPRRKVRSVEKKGTVDSKRTLWVKSRFCKSGTLG